MMRVAMEFPFTLLDTAVSDNRKRRLHWTVNALHVRETRNAWGWEAKRQLLEDPELERRLSSLLPPLFLEWRVYFGRRRELDDDNIMASLKPGRDGLVDAGVLAGDGPKVVRGSSVEQLYGEAFPRIELVIRDAEWEAWAPLPDRAVSEGPGGW